MTEPPAGLALLRQPMPPHLIAKLPKVLRRDDPDKGRCERGSRYSADGHYCSGWHAKAMHLDYAGHAAVTDRLLDADPRWTWEPYALDANGLPALDANGGLWIRLTVCGVTRPGYGSADGKRGGDAIKELIGDAIRNAAMRFGVALDLWHKGSLHADEDAPVDTSTGEIRSHVPASAPSPARAALLRQAADLLLRINPRANSWQEVGADFAERMGIAISTATESDLGDYIGLLTAAVADLGQELVTAEASA